MRTQFAAQSRKLSFSSLLQDGLANSERPSQAGDDATDRGHFDLRCCIADEVNVAVAYAPLHRNPAAINRDTRTLPIQRIELFFFEKALETFLGVAAVFADDSQSAAVRRLRNQPVEIRRVVGHEPHSG